MTTSMDSTNSVTISLGDTKVIYISDFILDKDKHAVSVCMNIKNFGVSPLLLCVNNFCLVHDETICFTKHCYINDGHSFEVVSGWRSFQKEKTYTLITKYTINPNLPTYHLCYKTATESYSIMSL